MDLSSIELDMKKKGLKQLIKEMYKLLFKEGEEKMPGEVEKMEEVEDEMEIPSDNSITDSMEGGEMEEEDKESVRSEIESFMKRGNRKPLAKSSAVMIKASAKPMPPKPKKKFGYK